MVLIIEILWVVGIVGATFLSRRKKRVSYELMSTLHQNDGLRFEEVAEWCKKEQVAVDYIGMLL